MDKQTKSEDVESLNGNAEQAMPGIFVYVERDDTRLQVSFEPIGGFDILAAPSVLELAYKVARRRLGLDG